MLTDIPLRLFFLILVRIVRINPCFVKVPLESLQGKLLKMALYPHYPHFRPRPLIGGAGIAGRPCLFPFRDISGIAGKGANHD